MFPGGPALSSRDSPPRTLEENDAVLLALGGVRLSIYSKQDLRSNGIRRIACSLVFQATRSTSGFYELARNRCTPYRWSRSRSASKSFGETGSGQWEAIDEAPGGGIVIDDC